MGLVGAVALLLAFVAAVYASGLYNQLVLVKHNVSKAWANIDVLLKQRNDELPKLVAVCREYLQHESALLERLTLARSESITATASADAAHVGATERTVRDSLQAVFAVAEAYPTLRANEQFAHLSRRISELEIALADRREFYNETVRINNVTVEQFPSRVIAGPLGFRAADLLYV